MSVRDRQPKSFGPRQPHAHALTQAQCVDVASRAASLSVKGGYRTGGGVARPTNYHIVPSINGGVLGAVRKLERNRWWLGGEIEADVFEVTSRA